jgi:hypothetical protein
MGTRDEVAVHQHYTADVEAGARHALGTVDGTPYYQKYPDNPWAAVKGHPEALADAAARPVIKKYTGVLGPWTCSRPPPPSRSWSRSASTSATAWTFTREPATVNPTGV